MARASASAMPTLRPRRAAAAFIAVTRSADFAGATTTSASSGAERVGGNAERATRSVASRASHTDR